MATRQYRGYHSVITFLTDYARQGDDESTSDELTIPEDLTELSDEALNDLTDQAVEAFEALYGDGDLSEESLAQLNELADGIEALRSEQDTREQARTERRDQAAEVAARVRPAEEPADEEGEGEDTEGGDSAEAGEASAETDDTETSTEVEQTEELPEPVAASARREVRVNLGGLKSRQNYTRRENTSENPSLITAAPDLPGFANGQGIGWDEVAQAVDTRLAGFNRSTFQRANAAGRHLRNQHGVATLRRPFEDGHTVNEPGDTQRVIDTVTDETRLPGSSLVAAGGWCAPSETIYDLCEMESRDGLVSLPEMGVSRGGIRYTQGPDFSSIFNQTGFCYTEAEDEAGDYDGEGGGTKPCFNVECPEFTENRLGLCGTCITAGLLQQRGYPEVIARTIRGAMIAHEHRVAANVINAMVADSDAVDFPADQVGATAPLLAAVELQVEHMKGSQRMNRNTSMEAIFPFWVHGAIRADLSRRLGVDLLSVGNGRINQWFGERGINPQFVYNWQGLESTPASGATSFPAEVSFLMYPAGTWVKGASDIISLDTVYDSTLLGTNDYTALFAEEGWLVAKLCHDSRQITVPICADGATAGGVEISCDGTAGA